MKPVKAWAWKIRDWPSEEWVLCRWAEPERKMLLVSDKPSPEARIVRVEIREVPKKARKS